MLLFTVIFSSVLAEEATTFDIEIRERKVVSEPRTLRVDRGDQVRMIWRSDEDVSIHLHGYDIELRIIAGEQTSMEFSAHATGRFPVTSHGFAGDRGHHGHQALLYLEVYPE